MRTKSLNILMFSVLSILNTGGAQGALTVDRSRLIFNEGEKSVSLNVTNRNEHDPYLAQGWMEDGDEKKIAGPLMVLPPLQRIEAGAKTIVRVQELPELSRLPKDRESVFYFNLREIPPKTEKKNVLSLALQTRLKVFYRPASLKVDPATSSVPGTDRINIKKNNNKYVINNPTKYYFTFTDARNSLSGNSVKDFSAVMVPPEGSVTLTDVSGFKGDEIVLFYVNDYGSQIPLTLQCDAKNCTVLKDIVKSS